ncbi:MAG: hypothetical protein RDU76_06265 [Candidatus Edwardsbacteria bacterium]|nr:hypothetical protein [Candidatus Edwardsbacteria bacterium]
MPHGTAYRGNVARAPSNSNTGAATAAGASGAGGSSPEQIEALERIAEALESGNNAAVSGTSADNDIMKSITILSDQVLLIEAGAEKDYYDVTNYGTIFLYGRMQVFGTMRNHGTVKIFTDGRLGT